MTRAYSIAKDYYIEGGNNRIIMASDGDLNVGISSEEELKSYIEGKRNEGIFLSVLGFGTGNYKDATMSALAQNGNGVYYYIDGEREAEKVLGTDLLSTLYTVAKDVKFQLEFNKDRVEKYRLIGYESRLLNTEDFDDDTKDAGDVGAGHTMTVCYELMLYDEPAIEHTPCTLATLAMRYKAPDSDESVLREYTVAESAMTNTPTDDFKFVGAVIEATMILNGSKYNADKVTMSDVYETLTALDLSADAYKTEFKNMIKDLLPKAE
jgi:Ca-activated chloride channel family protein